MAKQVKCGADCKQVKMPSGMHKMPNGMMMKNSEMKQRSNRNNKSKY